MVWLRVGMDVLMADLTVQPQYVSVESWGIAFGARGHKYAMGLSRSSVGVGAENGRPYWLMKMVKDDDVGG